MPIGILVVLLTEDCRHLPCPKAVSTRSVSRSMKQTHCWLSMLLKMALVVPGERTWMCGGYTCKKHKAWFAVFTSYQRLMLQHMHGMQKPEHHTYGTWKAESHNLKLHS